MVYHQDESPILLIDGECVLCNRMAQFVIRRDPAGRFHFAALQSEYAKNLLREAGQPPPDLETFVLVQGRDIFHRSEAAFRLLGMMPFPWRLAGLGFWIPRRLRDWGYDLVARNRRRLFGATPLCGLLTPEERARFLSGSDRLS